MVSSTIRDDGGKISPVLRSGDRGKSWLLEEEEEVVVEVEVEVEAKLAEVDEGSEMGSVIFFVVGLFLRFGEEEEDIGSLLLLCLLLFCLCMSHTMGKYIVLGLPACVAAVLFAGKRVFSKKTDTNY